jgi:catechol 2,3-dioxygenase-like lactoylglutathione lyase family enzyme
VRYDGVMAGVDHLIVGAADLDDGVAWVRQRLGVAPVPGGVHDGAGTRNALLGLGEQYLEVLALDPAQPGVGTPLAAQVAGLAVPALINLAIAVDDIAAVVAELRTGGVGCSDPIGMSRVRPDGVRLTWELAFPAGAPAFLIDWKGPNPSAGLPQAGRLTSLAVRTPVPELFELLGLDATRGSWCVEADVDGVALV